MSSLFPVQAQPFTIYGAGPSIGDIVLILSSFNQIGGAALTMASFGTIGTGTIEPNTVNEEQIVFTSITANSDGTVTLGGVSSVAFVSPYTQTSGLLKSHIGGSVFVLSDTAYLYSQYANVNTNENITGSWTAPTPTAPTQIAIKSYVDGVATSGATFNAQVLTGIAAVNLTKGNIVYLNSSGQWAIATDATATTVNNVLIGIVQATVLSGASVNVLTGGLDNTQTGLVAGTKYYIGTAGAISTSTGTNGVYLGTAQDATHLLVDTQFIYNPIKAQNDALAGNNGTPSSTDKFVTQTGLQLGAELYAADTSGAANTLVIALSPAITAYTAGQVVHIKVSTTNTGNTTVAINGLAAKNLYKQGFNPLVANDIVAGQIITAIYDGTQFLLQTASDTFINSTPPPFVTWDTQLPSGGSTATTFLPRQYTTAIGGLSSSNLGYVILGELSSGTTVKLISVNYEPTSGLRTLGGVISSTLTAAGQCLGICVAGSNVYAAGYNAGFVLYRYTLALGTETLMTMAGGTYPTGIQFGFAFSDGTNIYVHSADASNVYYKYTISGTTATYSSSITYTGIGNFYPWSDGTSVWAASSSGIITKWALAGGASTATGITIPTSNAGFAGFAGVGNYLDTMWGSIQSYSTTLNTYLSMNPLLKP